MKHIASRDNPHFKALKKLCQSGRERRKTGRLVLDGMHLIDSYAQHFGKPEEVIVSESGSSHHEIVEYICLATHDVPVSVLADVLFSELATVESPSGIMAVIAQPRCTHAINHECDAVLLDGIQDPGNLGSIMRSAAAAGFRQILLSADCAQAWSPKTLRSAMGAHFQLDVHENSDLPAFLAAYRGATIVTALQASSSVFSLSLKSPVAWIFGNEGQGVRLEVFDAAKIKTRIPMPGASESLNVAAAAAICLFETVRQRQL